MSDKKTILLVEDNPDILWANHAMFEGEGFAVVTAESLSDTRERLGETQPDVIVLDLMLPDGNALDFVPEIREKTSAPILMLTALTEKNDQLAGLRAGGDDYITKPYDIDELLARVEAFLRREELNAKKVHEPLTIGPIMLDIMANQAYVNGDNLGLAGKEFAVLLLLAGNKDKTLDKAKIYETIWRQPMAGDDNALKSVIYRLRKKLEASKSGYDIVSGRGEGYTFIEG